MIRKNKRNSKTLCEILLFVNSPLACIRLNESTRKLYQSIATREGNYKNNVNRCCTFNVYVHNGVSIFICSKNPFNSIKLVTKTDFCPCVTPVFSSAKMIKDVVVVNEISTPRFLLVSRAVFAVDFTTEFISVTQCSPNLFAKYSIRL